MAVSPTETKEYPMFTIRVLMEYRNDRYFPLGIF
jgi:hypothetical protein